MEGRPPSPFVPLSASLRSASRLSDERSLAASPIATAQAEIDLRRKAELERNSWKARALKAEKELEIRRAAANDYQGVRSYMGPTNSHMYTEAAVLREKMRRWHPDD